MHVRFLLNFGVTFKEKDLPVIEKIESVTLVKELPETVAEDIKEEITVKEQEVPITEEIEICNNC